MEQIFPGWIFLLLKMAVKGSNSWHTCRDEVMASVSISVNILFCQDGENSFCLDVVAMWLRSDMARRMLTDKHSTVTASKYCPHISCRVQRVWWFIATNVFHVCYISKLGGWWRWALVSPDGVAPAGWSVCLPLLIFPCTIKSRSSLLAPAHPGGPGKRAVKRSCVCVCAFPNCLDV